MEQEARIFKALSEVVRLRLMVLLTHGELRVQDLVDITGLPQSTISRHLAYLKNEGLLVVRQRGVESVYGVNRSPGVLGSAILGCLEQCFCDNRIVCADLGRLAQRYASMGVPGGDVVRVLFVCVHNAARSQIAEAYARKLGSTRVVAASGGTEPGGVSPVVIEALAEEGIDLGGARSKRVDDLLASGCSFEYVITVCHESQGERCPVFPGAVERLHWEFEDPCALAGDYAQRLDRCRGIRDGISKQVQGFLVEKGLCAPSGSCRVS